MSNEWITSGDWRHYKLIECEVRMRSNNRRTDLAYIYFLYTALNTNAIKINV